MSEKADKENKTNAWMARIEAVCARQEKSPSDVLTLLKRWGADPETAQRILDRLKAGQFVNEERYARAFVKDKVRIERWGFIKIRLALRRKGIAESIAGRALEEFDGQVYRSMIRNELEKKHKMLKDGSAAAWQKLARFGASRGYEMDIMYDMLDDICRGKR